MEFIVIYVVGSFVFCRFRNSIWLSWERSVLPASALVLVQSSQDNFKAVLVKMNTFSWVDSYRIGCPVLRPSLPLFCCKLVSDKN